MPLKAAELAQQAKVKIYTIFVGPNQRRRDRYMENGEEVLREIASSTNGNYFRARNTQELDQIYKQLDRLEPVEQDKEFFRPRKSLFYWPLSLGLALLTLFLIAQQLQNLIATRGPRRVDHT